MELMKRYPDNYFELAIVDPPYGIGMDRTIGIGIGKKKGFTKKKEYKQKNGISPHQTKNILMN